MRSCVVEKCTNSDSIILCHRFPKNRNIAKKWQMSLNLKDYQLDTLMSKYVVCCQHFDERDYRNPASNCLNSTAVPKLNVAKPRPISSMCTTYSTTELRLGAKDIDDKGSASPLNESDSIELLNRDDCNDATESSTSTSTSTSMRNKERRDRLINPLTQSMDATDFTMLDANGCTMYTPIEHRSKSADAIDDPVSFGVESQDSSDNSNECTSRSTDGFRPCSTDSDVDVLESESLQNSCNDPTKRKNNTLETSCLVIPNSADMGSSIVRQLQLLDAQYSHLDRFGLMQVIQRQNSQIADLRKRLEVYKTAHDNFFTHFDAFRRSVCDHVIM